MREKHTDSERANETDRERWGVRERERERKIERGRERKREKFALGKNGQNQALSVRAPSLHFSRPSAAVQSRRALPT